MSGSMFQLESSNIQNILIALVVICAIVYGFIEFRKVNMKLEVLESKLSKITQPMEMEMYRMPQPSPDNMDQNMDQNMDDTAMDDTAMNDTTMNDEAESLLSREVTSPDSMINQVENENEIVEQSGIDKFVIEQDISSSGIVEPMTEVVEPMTEKGIFVSVMTKLSKTIDITKDEGIVELDENDSPLTSYIPTDNKDPIPELNYEEFSIKELKVTLEGMELSTSGNKTKLIERILSNKK